jgi:PAS domain S-box-containing protein
MSNSYSLQLEKKIKDQLTEIVRLSNLNKAIVNNAGMTLITTDKNGIIKTLNNEAKRVLGYNPEDLINTQLITNLIEQDIFSKQKRSSDSRNNDTENSNYKTFKTLRDELQGRATECSLVTKDGVYIPVMLSITDIYKSSHSVSGFIFSATDITQQKELEQSLRRTIEKEKELNEMKSNFVAAASHELRTPLATTILASESLLNHNQKMDPEKIFEKITKIHAQLQQLVIIVDNILELSKIETGKIKFEPVNTELISLCTRVIKNSDRPDRIILNTQFNTIYMNLDRTVFSTAMNNLITNAIKFSDSTIKIEIIIVENTLSISVTDQGIGIPYNDQKYIFTPFFRAGNATLINGNGMGLKIAMESVKRHNGTLSFQSTPEKGSTFNINLPVSLINSIK